MMDERFQEEIENEKSPTEETAEVKAENFKVSIPEDDISEVPAENAEVSTEIADVPEEGERAEAQEETEAKADTVAVPVKTSVKPQADAVRKVPAKASQRRRAPAVSQKQIKEEKKAKNTVVILACIMAIITLATGVLGTVTDIFKGDDLKAVAVLILPQQDKEELEKHLAKLWPLTDVGFDTEKNSGEELFEYIRPYSKDGLYASFGYSAVAVTDVADPAERFKDENGSYSYFKIPRKEIDSILGNFGLEENHALNSEKVYYYDAK